MSREDDTSAGSPSLEGRYANYFEVGHNATEFLMDFGQLYPERDAAMLHTRIVTTPNYAKEFGRLLNESLSRYEEHFGVIDC